MPLQHSRILALCLLAASAHAEAAAPKSDEEAVITPPPDCHHYGSDKSWTLTKEARLSEILKALSDLTCERFFISRALLDEKLTVDVGKEPMSSYELHSRVEGALRAKGIVLDIAPASRVRRSSDSRAGAVPSIPYSSSRPSIPAERLDKGIKCASSDRCTITRDVVDALLANTTDLAVGARIIPAIKNGQANGFKLYAIRPDSIYGRLGLQNGDTIQSMNGLSLTTPDKALEAYTKLRNATLVKVEGERRGQKFTLEWTIK